MSTNTNSNSYASFCLRNDQVRSRVQIDGLISINALIQLDWPMPCIKIDVNPFTTIISKYCTITINLL